jgi:hypothetical protein
LPRTKPEDDQIAPPGNLRPGISIRAGDRSLWGVEGSSTWDGIARDLFVELPTDWLEIDRGQSVTFAAEGPRAQVTFLTVFRASSVLDRSMTVAAAIELDSHEPSWRADLPAGRYVLTVARQWGRDRDVAHAFGIEVRPADGKGSPPANDP